MEGEFRLTIPSVPIPYRGAPHTNAGKVRNFTEDSLGVPLPKVPRPMENAEVFFVIKMVMTELIELAAPTSDGLDNLDKGMMWCFEQALKEHYIGHKDYKKPEDPTEVIAEQADAMVDAMYYMYNAAAKVGVDLDQVFTEVHEANERKRGPDGKFMRREDGKVIKPPGWTEPDVIGVIKKMSN